MRSLIAVFALLVAAPVFAAEDDDLTERGSNLQAKRLAVVSAVVASESYVLAEESMANENHELAVEAFKIGQRASFVTVVSVLAARSGAQLSEEQKEKVKAKYQKFKESQDSLEEKWSQLPEERKEAFKEKMEKLKEKIATVKQRFDEIGGRDAQPARTRLQ